MELVLPIGYEVGDCQITSVLDQGGFGITYIADHPRFGKVVLKELCPLELLYRRNDFLLEIVRESVENVKFWEVAQEGFARESEALIGLGYEGIPAYLDRFSANNTLYLVQEYIYGDNLFKQQEQIRLLAQQQPIFLEDFLRSILNIVSKVHRAGILHRDIKPANILMRRENFHPVLIDFGGARFQVGGKTFNFDKRVWSPGYSSYEQLDINGEGQEQNESSDLYSIAATFYFLLFSKDPIDSLDRVSGGAPRKFIELEALYDIHILESLDIAFELFQDGRFENADQWINFLDQKDLSLRSNPPLNCYWLGRDPDPDEGGISVPIEDMADTAAVSRSHVVVMEYDDGYVIKDLSSNGTSISLSDAESSEFIPIDVQTDIGIGAFSLSLAGYIVSSTDFIKPKIDTSIDTSENDHHSSTSPVLNDAEKEKSPESDTSFPNHVYASFGQRCAAILVDIVLLCLLSISVSWFIVWNQTGAFYLSYDEVFSFNNFVYVLPPCVIILKVGLWSFKGYDVGKWVVNLNVVDLNTGKPPSLVKSILRFIGYIFSTLPLLFGFFWIVFDKRNQAWHDKFANTVVLINSDGQKDSSYEEK